jgi:hypothetical protein
MVASRRLTTKRTKLKVKVTLLLTVSQSVSLGVEPRLRLMTRYLLLFDSYGLFLLWSALSDERMGLSFVYAAGSRQRRFFLVRVPWDSWTSFVASYDSQGHGGGIRPRLHTGKSTRELS